MAKSSLEMGIFIHCILVSASEQFWTVIIKSKRGHSGVGA